MGLRQLPIKVGEGLRKVEEKGLKSSQGVRSREGGESGWRREREREGLLCLDTKIRGWKWWLDVR